MFNFCSSKEIVEAQNFNRIPRPKSRRTLEGESNCIEKSASRETRVYLRNGAALKRETAATVRKSSAPYFYNSYGRNPRAIILRVAPVPPSSLFLFLLPRRKRKSEFRQGDFPPTWH